MYSFVIQCAYDALWYWLVTFNIENLEPCYIEHLTGFKNSSLRFPILQNFDIDSDFKCLNSRNAQRNGNC